MLDAMGMLHRGVLSYNDHMFSSNPDVLSCKSVSDGWLRCSSTLKLVASSINASLSHSSMRLCSGRSTYDFMFWIC